MEKKKPTPKRLSDYNSNSSYDSFIAEEYEKEDECYKDMIQVLQLALYNQIVRGFTKN